MEERTCKRCGSELITIPWTDGYILACDNASCNLYRTPVGTVNKVKKTLADDLAPLAKKRQRKLEGFIHEEKGTLEKLRELREGLSGKKK